MKTMTFKTQYRKFRILTARFFSYWFFIIFATLGVAVAVMERFTKILGVEHLEPVMILILAYTILIYIVTERAKVLDDIQENLQSAKAEVYPTRESVYMAVPLIIARASTGPGMWRVYEIYNIPDEDLIIGVDDPRYYRASSAVHLRGRDPVRLATEYFYSLWNDPRIRVLKKETGVDQEEIEKLRAEFRAIEREGKSLPAA